MEDKCKLCGLGPDKPEDLGQFTRVGNTFCHANCMYFSSNLKQNTDIDNPWLGFNERDIFQLVKKVSRISCVYCEHGGANVTCARKGCKRRYHFACGLPYHVTYQFHDSFQSFCHKHRVHYRKLNLPSKDGDEFNERCVYCFEDLTKKTDKYNYLQSQCCNGTFMHIKCAKVGALNAGAFTKCPGCNSDKTFIAQLLTIGVNVPHADASWEDNNNFSDLYEPLRSCTAPRCIHPDSLQKDNVSTLRQREATSGRMRNDRDGYWKLVLCRLCGGNEIHKGCLQGITTYQKWYKCRVCTDIEMNLQLKMRKNKRLNSGQKTKKLIDYNIILPQSSRVLRTRNC